MALPLLLIAICEIVTTGVMLVYGDITKDVAPVMAVMSDDWIAFPY